MSKARKGTRRSAEGGSDGNTKSSLTYSESSRLYCFTWNNYTEEDVGHILQWLKSRKNLLYVFQKEIGKNGTPHLQGCFKSKSSIPFTTLKTLFPKVHWEKCRNWEASMEYCLKPETSTGEYYTNINLPRPLQHHLDLQSLKEWHKMIINLFNEIPDPRTIIWLWSKLGNLGKTSLARYLADTYGGRFLFLDGMANDVKYAVQEYLSNKDNRLDVAVFGYTKTMENKISYSAIESIKDGIFFSSKYKAGMVRFNCPHVVIIANYPPNIKALSIDRWKIINVDQPSMSQLSNLSVKTTRIFKSAVYEDISDDQENCPEHGSWKDADFDDLEMDPVA